MFWTFFQHSQMFYFRITGSEKKGKHKWGEAEVDAVERHMMHFIQGHRIPQKNDCVECLEAEPEALSARTWKGVKDYVRNRITALERQSGTSVCRSAPRTRRWWVKQCANVWFRVAELVTRIQVHNWFCCQAETVFSCQCKDLHVFIIVFPFSFFVLFYFVFSFKVYRFYSLVTAIVGWHLILVWQCPFVVNNCLVIAVT